MSSIGTDTDPHNQIKVNKVSKEVLIANPGSQIQREIMSSKI